MRLPATWPWLALAAQALLGPASASACTPHAHWVSHGARAGESIMVAAWCLGEGAPANASHLLIDGAVRVDVVQGISPLNGDYGPQAALISDPLPPSVGAGPHTVAVVTSSGQASNTLRFNNADLWWVQGDEGPAATAGGWIRAFGRDLSPLGGPDGATTATTPPPELVREWDALRAASGHSASAQLERLRSLVARHREWLFAKGPSPTTTLTLTPVGGEAEASPRAAPTVIVASSASSYTAEFQVPAGLAPGEYAVAVAQCGEAACAPSHLDCFESPQRPRVRTIVVQPPAPAGGRVFDVSAFGPSGVNITRDPATPPYGTTGSGLAIDATPALQAALRAAGAAAAADGKPATVRFGAGAYHVNGPVRIPDGVTVAGAGADLTAVYFAYDNLTTAPQVLIGPAAASNHWGLADFTLYVLGFHFTVIHAPADATRTARFRMSGVTVRADAFHCQNGMGGLGGSRDPAWFLPCNASCGTMGGYMNAVLHLGRLTNATDPTAPVAGDVSTGPANTPAVNVAVEGCDISGSYHLFQGQAEHVVLRSNALWNGGMAFYLIARQAIVEGNSATGSSVISGGGGYNFAQHLYHGNNLVRKIRGNDREVMTYDGESGVFHGSPLTINATHVVTPACPGRPDSRFDGNPVAGCQILVTAGPGTGQLRRVVNASMPDPSSSEPCAFEIDKPFDGLDGVPEANLTVVITAFTGRNIFDRDTFEDGGPFQFYNSGMHDVAAGITFRRTEGGWTSGMDVAMPLRNGSTGPGSPNPAYFNEFVDNVVAVGHRAPHLGAPSRQNRDLFWQQPVAKGLFSMGMAGQGTAHSNRFIVFRRNRFVGANGINVWGIGTSDVLVESNVFNSTGIDVALDHFPGTLSAVTNVVIQNSSRV